MVQKRYLRTQGYKPEKNVNEEFQFDNITKEKISFTDKSHARYRVKLDDKYFKEHIAIAEKKDDHTIVVNIKKRK